MPAVGGGGVYGFNRVTVTRSTIANNRADAGRRRWDLQRQRHAHSQVLDPERQHDEQRRGAAIENYGTRHPRQRHDYEESGFGIGGGVESDSSDPITLNAVTRRPKQRGHRSVASREHRLCRQEFADRPELEHQSRPLIATPGRRSLRWPQPDRRRTPSCTGIFGPATHDFTDLNPRIAQLADTTVGRRRRSRSAAAARRSTTPAATPRAATSAASSATTPRTSGRSTGGSSMAPGLPCYHSSVGRRAVFCARGPDSWGRWAFSRN